MGGVPREQKMLKGHLPGVIYHRVYFSIQRLYVLSAVDRWAELPDAADRRASLRDATADKSSFMAGADAAWYTSRPVLRLFSTKYRIN
jgi:hypothetical protein